MRKMMNEQLSISENNPIKASFYDYDHFTYPWHFHSEYEIIYVNESTGKRFVGDSIEEYAAGDLVLLGPDLPHYMSSDDIYKTNNKELRVKGTIVQFEKSFMNHSIEFYPQFSQIKRLLKESLRGIHFPVSENVELIRLIEEVPLHTGIKQITTFLYLLEKMATVKNRRLLASPHFQDSPSIITDSRIKKVLSYINYHYTRQIQLQEIASVAAMNTTAFCRYFKEKTGKTYVQFILELRIGYACQLLKMDQTEISLIALKCGFLTMTHFGKIFKRQTGMTPTEYREVSR